MATTEKENQEKRYQIGDFAKATGLTRSTLRYYEKEALLKPNRLENGIRYYTQADIDWVKFILHLKSTGMTIEQLKQYVMWRAQGDTTISQRLALLQKVRHQFLQEFEHLQHSLTILTSKIDWYQGKVNGQIQVDEDFAMYLKRLNRVE